MSRLELPVAALVLCCAMSAAHAAPLLLEVWRNGVTDHAIVHLTAQGGALLIPADELPLLGVKVTAPSRDGQIDLAKLAGVDAVIDQAGQRLLLTAAPQSLPRQLYDLGAGAATTPTPGAAGATLRYDLSATDADVRRFGDTGLQQPSGPGQRAVHRLWPSAPGPVCPRRRVQRPHHRDGGILSRYPTVAIGAMMLG
jgi:hypothetical protein